VWLHAGLLDRVPAPTRELLERRELRMSPMVVLELQYLFEVDRVRAEPAPILAHLSSAIGLRVADEPFGAVVEGAVRHTWTRDPFDRLIVAHAELASADLLTKDETIHAHYDRARWSRADRTVRTK